MNVFTPSDRTPPAVSSGSKLWWFGGALFILFALLAMAKALNSSPAPAAQSAPAGPRTPDSQLVTATFGAGCFWCTEAVLQRVDGVKQVTCGFMGGTLANPTYEDVCTGETGHAEVVQVKFDPKVISYDQLLAWFWRLHDPTSLNRQGADEGTQYRSVIFYYDDAQHAAALKSMAAAQKDFSKPIVTQIVPAGPFYSAEAYHQDYFNHNANGGYCQYVIAPKLDHLGLSEDPSATKTDR
jgi:peptide-methionine (S)-S-oxide reductase